MHGIAVAQTNDIGLIIKHWGVAGILQLVIQVATDEIEKALEIGVTGVPGELLAGVVEAGQKGEYFF